ncbi:MAG: M48 family metallopeptidase [Butyrivibrio sp.]|nr:M48 family metallopeptidase [Acetatifactor muris]MCM1561361.1 M48 family metallopeptidase [Butyrivibrio sp.]
MNYKLIAVLVVTLTFFFRTFMLWLEIKSANREIPGNVKDVYDAPAYGKWLQYYQEKTRLAFIRHLLSYLTVYLVLGLDAYAWLVWGLSPAGDYAAAIVVPAADMLVGLLVAIPCDYVNSMIIEQKYGFNKMTKKTFFLDRLKSTVLELAAMCGLCCLFIWLHKALGNLMIPVFIGIAFLLLLLLVFLYPVFSKIFNKFTPLPEGELKDKLCGLLEENGCTVKEIKVMDGSRRSTKANAYFSGIGSTKTIVLYDTLLEQMSAEEIVAVFAHEMGHNKHKDNLKMQAVSLVNLVVMVLLVWTLVSVPEIYGYFGFDRVNYGFAFYLLGTVCLSFLSPFLGLFSAALSRRFEYRADRFAKEQGYGDALISALKVLARNSFICLSPHPLLVSLTYDHPTVSQRIGALE